MKYEKPEIVAAGSAIESVQGSLIKDSPAKDHSELTTVGAYQSDEE
jgi:hypothetical protein